MPTPSPSEPTVELLAAPGGHRVRSRVLARAFRFLGAKTRLVRAPDELRPADLWVIDVPHPASVLPPDPSVPVLLMGACDPRARWCWHPLGPPPEQGDWPGPEHLIVDPGLELLRGLPPRWDLVVYLGTRHPLRRAFYHALRFPKGWRVVWAQGLAWGDFVAVLARARRALLGWGQSAFEALYLGIPLAVVPARPEHATELQNLPVPVLTDPRVRPEDFRRLEARPSPFAALRIAMDVLCTLKGGTHVERNEEGRAEPEPAGRHAPLGRLSPAHR